jgi:cold shock CspA family protein
MSASKDGKVIWFNEKKGFGYGKDAMGNLIYLHYSDIVGPEKFKTLKPGQTVRLTYEHDGEKFRATRIKPVTTNR